MNTQEIIDRIHTAKKKTPVKVYLQEKAPVTFPESCRVFGQSPSKIIFGEWSDIAPVLEAQAANIADVEIENDRRNSAIPLLDLKNINARIEPGVTIRENVEIGDNAVIMMGAVINIGAVIGEGTMIDMNAVLGARATIGRNCHIGAGAVIAGVLEPPSADPVIIEDNVLIGANAVVLEGCRIGKNSVVAAGSVVTEDIPADSVAAGSPAVVVKTKDEKTAGKTQLLDDLRD